MRTEPTNRRLFLWHFGGGLGGIAVAGFANAGCGEPTKSPDIVAAQTKHQESGQTRLADARKAQRIDLTLATVSDAAKDRVRVQLTAINTGQVPVAWDTEFAVFMSWRIKAIQIYDGVAVDPEYISGIRQPSQNDLKRRFKILAPGESVSKEFEPAKSVRRFFSMHSIDFSRNHQATGYEAIVRYPVPPQAKGLRLSVEYHLNDDDPAGFRLWFKEEFKDAGLPEAAFASNEISVAFAE